LGARNRLSGDQALNVLASLVPELTAGEGNNAADVFIGNEGIRKEKLFHLAHQGFGRNDGPGGDGLIGSLEDRLKLALDFAEELGDRFVLILHFHARHKCKRKAGNANMVFRI
jgi:hypothetical protein